MEFFRSILRVMGELCRIIRHLGSGNQIDAAFVFARTDCVNMQSGWLQRAWLGGNAEVRPGITSQSAR
jgi:hypothetical protein